mgnify:CR=1 FL=1
MLFLVPSANHAVQGEAALVRAGIACRLIPAPRHVSSQCGVCLSVWRADWRRAEEALRAAGTAIEEICEVEMPSGTPSRASAPGEMPAGVDRPPTRGANDG